MGSCLSATSIKRSSCPMSSSTSTSNFGKIVRVVHINGSMDEYKDPVTAGEVMLKQPKHFVFAQLQLMSLDSKPLDRHAQLQLGNIYFLLPHSVYDSEMSPMDLMTISKRLTLAAQKYTKQSLSSSSSNCPTLVHSQKTNRFANRYVAQNDNVSSCSYYNGNDMITKHKQQQVGDRSPCSWKPILESIREMSFTGRSESDLQDYH